jgi:hypothetical protein
MRGRFLWGPVVKRTDCVRTHGFWFATNDPAHAPGAMKTALYSAAIFALLSLGVSTIVLTRDTHRIALDADKAIHDLDDAAKVQNLNLATDEAQLSAVMQHLDTTISTVNQAAVEQRAYWQKTSADSDRTVKALRLAVDRASLLLDHTDQQLNGTLLPDLDRQLQLTSKQAQFALGSVGHAGDALTFQLNDPAIADLAKQLDDSSHSLSLTADHLEKATADIQQDVHRLTRPPSFLKQLGMGILDVGAKLGSIAAGFVR